MIRPGSLWRYGCIHFKMYNITHRRTVVSIYAHLIWCCVLNIYIIAAHMSTQIKGFSGQIGGGCGGGARTYTNRDLCVWMILNGCSDLKYTGTYNYTKHNVWQAKSPCESVFFFFFFRRERVAIVMLSLVAINWKPKYFWLAGC